MLETYKWAFSTYTLEDKNAVAIRSFKDHFAIWFFQGVFIKDKAQVLINAQEGKTKAMRHWKFEPTATMNLDLIKTYVQEAMDNSRAGKVVKVERKKGYEMPFESANALKNQKLYSHFYGITEGKQRKRANYISLARDKKTKQSSITKITPMILAGKGLNDRYK